MTDVNQLWDVNESITYMKQLADLNLWFIEEPTSPDDVLGHAKIRKALKPYGIGVATGEHINNRVCRHLPNAIFYQTQSNCEATSSSGFLVTG